MQKYKKWGSFFNVLVFVIKAKAEAEAKVGFCWGLDLCCFFLSADFVLPSVVGMRCPDSIASGRTVLLLEKLAARLIFFKLKHLYVSGDEKSYPEEYEKPANVDFMAIEAIAGWLMHIKAK